MMALNAQDPRIPKQNVLACIGEEDWVSGEEIVKCLNTGRAPDERLSHWDGQIAIIRPLIDLQRDAAIENSGVEPYTYRRIKQAEV